MRYILSGIILMLLAFGLSWLHWTLGFVAAAVFLFFLRLRPLASGSLAFIAFFVVWSVVAWYWDSGNEGLLSSQMGELFGGISSLTLILLTGLIGAIPAFLVGLCVSLIRSGQRVTD